MSTEIERLRKRLAELETAEKLKKDTEDKRKRSEKEIHFETVLLPPFILERDKLEKEHKEATDRIAIRTEKYHKLIKRDSEISQDRAEKLRTLKRDFCSKCIHVKDIEHCKYCEYRMVWYPGM